MKHLHPNPMKKLFVTVTILGLLVCSCEEEVPEEICEMDFSTPPSQISKFRKWELPSYFKGFAMSSI